MSDLPPPPPPPAPPALDPAFVADATVTATDVSVWFGQKVALSELSCSFGPGVTGLLGPNGAGKTTLMRAITGLIPVNQGQVHVGGPLAPRRSGGVPTAGARARGRSRPARAHPPPALPLRRRPPRSRPTANVVDWALQTVDMVPAADRSMDGFSKGMRQRSKVAAALVKNPLVLVLDEPLNGADPVQRLRLIELFRRLGAEGRTVIVSSHVLNEVESMADRVIVVVRGRLAAAGGHRAIRDAMDDVPRHVLVRAPGGRRLASALLGNEVVSGINVDGDDLIISTTRAKELAVLLPQAARDLGVHLTEVRPLDDSLESLFRELVR